MSLTPYYSHAGITIYHGDCREILPQLPEVDLVLTDPPYGIDYQNSGGFCASSGWNQFERLDWDKQRPERDAFDAMRTISERQIIWGGNYFTDYLPPTMQWLVWDKGQRDFTLSDCEFAWSSQWKASRVFNYSRALALQDGKQHPTQKPLALMRWCLTFAPDARTVLDPFAGSGSTLVAAKDQGIQAIGIEICEKYCEIAAKRLSQEVLDFSGASI